MYAKPAAKYKNHRPKDHLSTADTEHHGEQARLNYEVRLWNGTIGRVHKDEGDTSVTSLCNEDRSSR